MIARIRSRGAWIPALAVVLAAAAVPASGHPPSTVAPAVSRWSPPEPISAEGIATEQRPPSILIDATGTTTAAWLGTDNNLFEHQGLVVRRKPAGATWLPEQVLDEKGAGSAALAADGAGNVTVAYSRAPGTRWYHRSYPFAMTAGPDGVFAPAVQLSSDGRVWSDVHLVIGPDGTATAAWVALLPDKHRLVMVAQRPGGGSWQPARSLSRHGMSPKELEIDVAESGEVTVLWFGNHFPSRASRVWARTLSAGEWSPSTVLTEPGETWVGDPQLSAGPRGTAMASWIHSREEFSHRVTVRRRPDGTWTEPRPLPGPPGYGGPSLARSAGRILMAWQVPKGDGPFTRLLARVHEHGVWGKVVQLAEPRADVGGIRVAGDGTGRFRVVWEYRRLTRRDIVHGTFSGNSMGVHTRSLGLDGRWSSVEHLTDTSTVYYSSTALSVGPDLASAVVWKQLDPIANWGRIHYAGIDGP